MYAEGLIGLKPKLSMPHYNGEAQIAVCISQAGLECMCTMDDSHAGAAGDEDR